MPTVNKHLNLKKVRTALRRHGTYVKYERAELCECGSIHNKETPEYTCSSCHGIGVRFYDPIFLIIQMVNKNSKAFMEKWGVQPEGSIGITIPDKFKDRITKEIYNEFVPGPWDKITCLQDRMKHSQLLEKGKVHDFTGETKEKAHYLNVIDNTTRITQRGVVYDEGTHYKIIDDAAGNHRIVSWMPGVSVPADGERYSFSYITNPTWIIMPDYPKHRRENSKMIMTHVVARLVRYVENFQ